MPHLMNEKSDSPERPSRHSRFKASTPIAIPPRRRSSPNTPISPDMLFEMSPVSPTLPPSSSPPPSSSIYPSASQSKPHETTIHERFMYHVPIIRHSPDIPESQSRHEIPRQTIMPLSTVTFRSGTEKPSAALPESNVAHTSEIAHNFPTQKEHVGTKRIQSTTKITGFTPINEHQPPIYEKLPRPTIPLHPPPRRPSFSSSPWLLPSRNDRYEDDVSYSQADPSQFEFQRHLLRRIENQDPSRYKSAQTQCF
ncbi:hypothetical protein BDN70DRAFT_870826 [Pholiota conissans]|uniref:Uncharacterized protein n=1 Tax=Pholiota conissans TaxID=109636 RepID=A0A9P5ZED0_9AGAR|nr:hypothetical protein BDN70DRAFT_870826 [Pholiota conissans]